MPKNYYPLERFEGGYVSNADPVDLGPTESTQLLNLEVNKRGALKIRDPYQLTKTFTTNNIQGFINWVDITNSDTNIWLVVLEGGVHKLYYNSNWNEQTFLGSGTVNDTLFNFYTDGNIVRISYSKSFDSKIMQHIKLRQFFYGGYNSWSTDGNSSGYYLDNARPQTNSTNYSFNPALIIPTRCGNLTLGTRYLYKFVPVFDGNQIAPLSSLSQGGFIDSKRPLPPVTLNASGEPTATHHDQAVTGFSSMIQLKPFTYRSESGSPVTYTNLWNPRITGMRVYRAEQVSDISNVAPSYRLISSIPLNTESSDKDSEALTLGNLTADVNKFYILDGNDDGSAVYDNNANEKYLHIKYTARNNQVVEVAYKITGYSNGVYSYENVDNSWDGSTYTSITNGGGNILPDLWNHEWTIRTSNGNHIWAGSRLCSGKFIITQAGSADSYDGEYDNCVIHYTNPNSIATSLIITDSAIIKYGSSYLKVWRVTGPFMAYGVDLTDLTNLSVNKNNVPIFFDTSTANTIQAWFYDSGLTPQEAHPYEDVSIDTKYEVQHIFNGRNWVGNVTIEDNEGTSETHPNAIMYSEIGMPDVIPITNFILLTDVQGGKVMGISHLGQDLMVLMSKGVFRVNIPSNRPTNFQISEQIPNVGCVAPKSVVTADGKVYFASDDAIYAIDYNFNLIEVSKSIRNITESANMANVVAQHDPRNNRIIFKIGTSRLLYALSTETFTWSQIQFSTLDVEHMTLNNNNKIVAVTNTTRTSGIHLDR